MFLLYSLGDCVQARLQSSAIACTPEGNFEPLQCRTQEGTMTCHCVSPSDGTRLPGTFEVIVNSIDDIPNCNILGTYYIYLLYSGDYNLLLVFCRYISTWLYNDSSYILQAINTLAYC